MTKDLKIKKHKRSLVLWILVAGLAIFSIGGWLRLIMTIQDWSFIQTLNLTAGAIYLALSGFLWGCGAVICAGLLWLEKRSGLYLTAGYIAIYTIWFWVDRLVITQSSTVKTEHTFAIGSTIFWVGLSSTLLLILFRRSRRYNAK